MRGAELAGYLHLADASRPVAEYRRAARRLLAPGPGDRVLDVGCGLGAETRRVARAVGPEGLVVGLDVDGDVLARAGRMNAGGGPAPVFCLGDVRRLPFPDAAFDAVRIERVLHGLDDIEGPVREAARVLAAGGRLLVCEPDWDTLLVDSTDPDTTERILASARRPGRGAVQGRRLRASLVGSGIEQVAVRGHTGVFGSLPEAWLLLGLGDLLVHAGRCGAVAHEEALAWVAGLREADAAGRFFASLTGFIASGRKPVA